MQGHATEICVTELREKKHVAFLMFLTFSYSPLRLPVVHLRVSCFRIFYISHCLGPSDGNHMGHVFILLTDENTLIGFRNHQCRAEIPGGKMEMWRGRGILT